MSTDNDIIRFGTCRGVAEGTTLLSYEMGWQLRLFDLMAASQQANDYIMACTYGVAFLEILGLKEIPEKKFPDKAGTGAEMASLQQWYTDLLMAGISKIGATIAKVRNTYGKDTTGIPKYKRQEVAA